MKKSNHEKEIKYKQYKREMENPMSKEELISKLSIYLNELEENYKKLKDAVGSCENVFKPEIEILKDIIKNVNNYDRDKIFHMLVEICKYNNERSSKMVKAGIKGYHDYYEINFDLSVLAKRFFGFPQDFAEDALRIMEIEFFSGHEDDNKSHGFEGDINKLEDIIEFWHYYRDYVKNRNIKELKKYD